MHVLYPSSFARCHRWFRPLLAGLLSTVLAFPAWAATPQTLSLSRLFSQSAVLQRGQPMQVWGWDRPGSRVEVAFDGHAAHARAGKDGRWNATLPAHAAGGPYVLRVSDGRSRRRVSDVMVGDVWLCSGQSNMEFTLAQAAHAAREVADSSNAAIRQFRVPKTWALHPASHLVGGDWKRASPWTTGTFSAVCWFFARDMQRHTGVPQGMIDSSWGGSLIQAWLPAAEAGVTPAAIAERVRRHREQSARDLAETRRHLARWDLHGAVDASTWSHTHLDTHDWANLHVPGDWEPQGYHDMDGWAWYRRPFTLTRAQAARDAVLGLGKVDDSDFTYVNGHLVGHTENHWDGVRRYVLPASVLHAGENTIAVRVHDNAAGGGIWGDPSLLYVQPRDGKRISLAGTWKFRPENVVLTVDPYQQLLPSVLYNQMIQPLAGYPLRGVVWYQGEQNAVPGQARRYAALFQTLIRTWRKVWHQPALPFMWVQLPNYISGEDHDGASPWAQLRASQAAALSLPHTGQAVTIDLGDPDNIHPTDKQDVGYRLSLVARRMVFGEHVVADAPTPQAARFDGARAVVMFAASADALRVRGGGRAVKGFELAGRDHRFHPARATLSGGHVTVTSDAVARPTAVRYAWSDNPVHANLIDSHGLPVAPFRLRERASNRH